MGEKPVTDLSGIGEVLGKKLEDQGFDKVRRRFNFMVLQMLKRVTEFHASKFISRPFSTLSTGLRGAGSVLATEEERRAVLQLAQGDVRR